MMSARRSLGLPARPLHNVYLPFSLYRLSYCILHFWTTIQAQRNPSKHFKIIIAYINKAISSDRRYRQIATATFNLRTWPVATLELEIINISSVTESKRIACNWTFEDQLFGYISLRMRKICILKKLNFKISRVRGGGMHPDHPHPPKYSRAFGAR